MYVKVPMNARSLGLLLLSVVFIGTGLLTRIYFSGKFHQKLVTTIQYNVESEFALMDREAKQLLEDQCDVSSPVWNQVHHFFVLADSNRILAWNHPYFLPNMTLLTLVDSVAFESTSRGDFLVKKWLTVSGSSLYGILKLTDRYPIINNFLESQWAPSIFPIKDLQIFGPAVLKGEPIVANGKTVFKILPEKPEVHESVLSLFLLSAGVVLLFIAVWRVKVFFERSFGYDLALCILFIGLLGIRLGMIAINLPALYFPSDVFDPKKFASSSLNASLGDLFLNATVLLILVVYMFLNFRKFKFVRWMLQSSDIQRYIAGAVCLLMCFLGLLFPYDFVEAIYHNSNLSLDITQSISFDAVRVTALAAVLTGCVTSFLFIHIFFSLANHLFEGRSLSFFVGLLIASLLFLLQFYVTGRNLSATMLLGIAFFSVLKISGLTTGAFRVSFRLFIYLIFSVSIFSFQNAWAVRTFYKERQVQDQFRFGKDFLTGRDVLGEYLLDQARQRIAKDQFIQTRMASLFLNKSAVADKIRRVYLNNYFDRYEITITTRNEGYKLTLQPKENADSVRSPAGKNFQPTDYKGISYTNASDGNAIKRYHVVIPVYYQRPVGAIELDLSLKRVIPDNVYPELLVDNRFNQIYRNRDFSYAVFTNGKLVSSFGPFNYERDFQIDRTESAALFDKGIADNNYFHIGIEDQDGPVAIVSAATYAGSYLITNFSFWFVLLLGLLFIGQGTFGMYAYSKGEKVNYTTRIQLFIFLAFLLPVLAVSITTLTLIGRSNEEAITNNFLERSITISQRIASLISNDSTKTINESNLENWIEENAASSKTDISVYSPDGKLMATSQPALFEDQLISPLMDRGAWIKIVLQREVQTVTNEQIGKLQYSCAYSSVLSPETGKLAAIVGLPFFESATFLQRSQSRILSNILIVFVLVFILFSLLSFWASSNLTFPIRFITRTLGQTTLTGQNKPLQWNSSDEIGMLVKEYNRMVENLDESKRALAQSEKETAWREMAKQVAHEIKNPLTPMKLTLQQMEQALKSGNLPIEKSQKSVDVLLKQVDILNQIAASFSTFASMPSSLPQKTDLNELLSGAVQLFDAETRGRVNYQPAENTPIVSVDATSFSRAISNIIINAFQSKKEGLDMVTITIRATIQESDVVISIQDNGKGMTREIQENVFQPHFTTKKSGSGLGLAMAMQIVRQAGGRIWFESMDNQGSTFFIELPLAR